MFNITNPVTTAFKEELYNERVEMLVSYYKMKEAKFLLEDWGEVEM